MNNMIDSPSEDRYDGDDFLTSLTKEEMDEFVDMLITTNELYFNLNDGVIEDE